MDLPTLRPLLGTSLHPDRCAHHLRYDAECGILLYLGTLDGYAGAANESQVGFVTEVRGRLV